MRQLIIGDRIISDDSDAYVIAEIGHNHQGSLKTAKELFRRRPNAASTPGSCRSATTARSTPARYATSRPTTRTALAPPTANTARRSNSASSNTRNCRRSRPAGNGVLLDGLRHQERGLPGRAEHARLQDRVGRSEEHPAAAPRRQNRQADDRQHRRRHHGRRAARV